MFLFCLVFAMFCARLFICALWSPAGKGLTSWLSFVVSTVPLVSWVRCGTLLYRFLIFEPLLTLALLCVTFCCVFVTFQYGALSWVVLDCIDS